VNGFCADSCRNRAPFVLVVVVALFMVPVFIYFFQVSKLSWSDVWFRFNKFYVKVY